MKLSNIAVAIRNEQMCKFCLKIPVGGEIISATLAPASGDDGAGTVIFHVLHDEVEEIESVGLFMANSRYPDQTLPDKLAYLCTVYHPNGEWHFFERH
jgi:hypothetical protein